jgi:hypothetical protein
MFNLFDIHDSDPMFKLFKESSSVCTDADRQLEASINARLERGSVSMYLKQRGPISQAARMTIVPEKCGPF